MRWVAALSASLLVVLPQIGPPGMVKSCTAVERAKGTCNVQAQNNNNEVIIDGTQRENSSNPNPVDNWAPNPNVPWVAPPTPEEELAECLLSWDDYIGCFE